MSEIDTVPVSPSPQPAGTPARSSWWDLLLYLLLGFGLFFAAGLVLREYLQQASILTSALIYSLNFIVFFGTVYLAGVRRGILSWAEIGFLPPRWNWTWLLLAFGIVMVFNPIRVALAFVIQYLIEGSLDSLMRSARMTIFAPDGFTWVSFFVTLALAGVAAPIAEELFFRGAIYTWFRRRYRVWVSVLASSLLFALGHADTFAVVITSFILGAVNALVFERTRSIWAPIAVHAVNNSLAVVLVYLALAFNMGQ